MSAKAASLPEMILVVDRPIRYCAHQHFDHACRLRLYQQESLSIALATDTSGAARIFDLDMLGELICREFGIDPARLMLIEHYDDRKHYWREVNHWNWFRRRKSRRLRIEAHESFQLAVLSPARKWLTGRPVTRLQVEELIGQPFD